MKFDSATCYIISGLVTGAYRISLSREFEKLKHVNMIFSIIKYDKFIYQVVKNEICKKNAKFAENCPYWMVVCSGSICTMDWLLVASRRARTPQLQLLKVQIYPPLSSCGTSSIGKLGSIHPTVMGEDSYRLPV